MLMKDKSILLRRGNQKSELADPETVALQILGCIVAEPQRLSRFLSLTGLDPTTIRLQATKPGFLSAVLDYVAADESLLIAIASEASIAPGQIAAAQQRMSGTVEDNP